MKWSEDCARCATSLVCFTYGSPFFITKCVCCGVSAITFGTYDTHPTFVVVEDNEVPACFASSGTIKYTCRICKSKARGDA